MVLSFFEFVPDRIRMLFQWWPVNVKKFERDWYLGVSAFVVPVVLSLFSFNWLVNALPDTIIIGILLVVLYVGSLANYRRHEEGSKSTSFGSLVSAFSWGFVMCGMIYVPIKFFTLVLGG